MIAYVKSHTDFSTKDILEFEKYTFSFDIEFSEKSTIVVLRKPIIANDDFVICKDGNKVIFFGICEDYSTDDSSGYTITIKQMECLFDRQIFLGTESVIKSTGIEDFIKSEIEANWTASGDTFLDKDYITVIAQTHTTSNATVDNDNGIYNFKTFLGNAKEYYGIFLEFEYTDTEITIKIFKHTASALPIDVTITDISDYTETYNINVLAKLITHWYNKTTDTTTTLTYYLKTNRTITTNASDPDRADGVIKCKYVEKNTQDEAIDEIINEFKSNSYEHKITFNLWSNSKAYPPSDYYVGRLATIKTKTGIQSSLITGMSFNSDSTFSSFVFGKLKVSLIDKLRNKV